MNGTLDAIHAAVAAIKLALDKHDPERWEIVLHPDDIAAIREATGLERDQPCMAPYFMGVRVHETPHAERGGTPRVVPLGMVSGLPV